MSRIAYVFLALFLGALAAGFIGSKIHKSVLTELQEALIFQKETTNLFIDKFGRSNIEVQQLSIEKKVLRRVVETLQLKNKKIAKNVKIVTKLQFVVEDSIVTKLDTVIINNGSHIIHFSADREFMQIRNGIAFSTADSAFVDFNYKYFGEVNLITYINKRFLKPNITEVRAVIEDPNASLTGLTTVSLKLPDKKYSFGFMVGYGLSKQGLSPFIGVGISRKIFRF